MEFLARACTFSAAVAFILPRSFNKYTFQDRIDPRFHLLGSLTATVPDARGAKAVGEDLLPGVVEGRAQRPVTTQATTHLHFEMRHCHLHGSALTSSSHCAHLRVHDPSGRRGLRPRDPRAGDQGKSLVHPTQGARCPQPVRAARLRVPGRHEHRAHMSLSKRTSSRRTRRSSRTSASGRAGWAGRDPTGPRTGR